MQPKYSVRDLHIFYQQAGGYKLVDGRGFWEINAPNGSPLLALTYFHYFYTAAKPCANLNNNLKLIPTNHGNVTQKKR